MAEVLLSSDARALRSLTRPRWLRRALMWVIFAAACVVMGLHNGAAPVPNCTDDAPCRPDAPAMVVGGLLLAAGFAGFLQARAAAWLASAFAVTVVGYDLLHPALASPVWVYIVDVVFVAVCFAVANVDRARPPTNAAMSWLARVGQERPPAPRALPRPARRWRAASIACALVALGLATWTWTGQAGMDAREQAARRVTGEVTAHPDGMTIRVRLPDGRFTDIDVLDANDHPVGGPLALYVDTAGLHQPVSEPYDFTGWLALAVIVAGVGLGCWRRGTERAAGLSALFAQAQPVTQVYVRAGWGHIAVYPADARPGEPAVAEIRCVPMTEALLDAVPVDDADDHQAALLPTRPALLYGIPAPERWCTVVMDGEPAVPTRPLRAKLHAPPFTEPSVTSWPTPATAELPLRAEEVEALDPADRDVNPYQVHSHSPHRMIGYAMTAGMPLVLAGGPAKLLMPALTYRTALVIAGLAAALACAVGWRLFLRSRLAWNAGGVAVVGAFGSGRFLWRQVHQIESGRHDVTIGAAYRNLVVSAPGRGGFTGRSAEQLANALRYAKERAVPEVDPPRLAAPNPPAGLYALWLVYTPLLAWVLQFFSSR